MVAILSDDEMKTRQAWCKFFWSKVIHGLSCGTSERCGFFSFFNPHTAAALAYVSPRPSWFILGTMSALGHVVLKLTKWTKEEKLSEK